MLSLVSPDGRAHIAVDEQCGARLASVRVDDLDLVVRDGPDALTWGCYPMVPYAGRVRDATLHMGTSTHALPVVDPPHALHGTVLAMPWTVLMHTDSRAVLMTELDLPWPVEGTVRHDIIVSNDAVSMRLDVTAHDDMPCQIGWHPWFVRPTSYTVPFRTMWPRDDSGIAMTTPVDHDPDSPRFGTYDDCLSEPIAAPSLSYDDHNIVVHLESSCSHWVVFDQAAHGVCLEPQTGAPNQINDDPTWLGFGESLSHFFRIGWTMTPR